MSPLSPDPYQPYLQPLRPRSLTVIGVLGIIFGSGGVLCLCIGLAGNLVKLGPQQPQMQMPMVDMILGIASAVIGLVLSLMLIIGAVGALNLKAWSRTLMIVIAGVDLIFEVFRLIASLVRTIPMMIEMMQHLPPETSTEQVQQVQKMLPYMKGLSYAMTFGVFVVQVVYMIAVILVMNSQKVKQSLAAPGAEPPPSGPPL